jgi:hypothetical protein
MEAKYSSELSAHFQRATGRYIPEKEIFISVIFFYCLLEYVELIN